MRISDNLKAWANRIKRDGVTLWFAGKNPQTLIWLTIRLLPPDVLAECRGQADEWMETKGSKPSSRVGAAFIVVLWLAIGAAIWFWLGSRP